VATNPKAQADRAGRRRDNPRPAFYQFSDVFRHKSPPHPLKVNTTSVILNFAWASKTGWSVEGCVKEELAASLAAATIQAAPLPPGMPRTYADCGRS
jgi:hypothetical protein